MFSASGLLNKYRFLVPVYTFHTFRFLAFPSNYKGPLPEPLFIENSGHYHVQRLTVLAEMSIERDFDPDTFAVQCTSTCAVDYQ